MGHSKLNLAAEIITRAEAAAATYHAENPDGSRVPTGWIEAAWLDDQPDGATDADGETYRAAVAANVARLFFTREVGGLAAALEHEQRVLSIGSEFLPPFARAVRDGRGATAEYWLWLTRQLGGTP